VRVARDGDELGGAERREARLVRVRLRLGLRLRVGA
jgi:hypothetical protein